MVYPPFREVKEGTLMRVLVIPNSTVSGVEGLDDNGRLVVRVTSPPAKGKANDEVVRILRKLLRARVEITSGHKSREKIVLVKGKNPNDVLRCLRG